MNELGVHENDAVSNCGFLIIMRHAKSQYNREKRWTGWHDPDIVESEHAVIRRVASALFDSGLGDLDYCICSTLKRTIKTAHFLLDALDRLWIETENMYLINERALGNLQGTVYDTMDERGLDEEALPPDESDFVSRLSFLASPTTICPEGLTESDKQVADRVSYCMTEYVNPRLIQGSNVLLVTHSGVLRIIMQHYNVVVERQEGEDNEFGNCDCVALKFHFSGNKFRAIQARHLRIRHNKQYPKSIDAS